MHAADVHINSLPLLYNISYHSIFALSFSTFVFLFIFYWYTIKCIEGLDLRQIEGGRWRNELAVFII